MGLSRGIRRHGMIVSKRYDARGKSSSIDCMEVSAHKATN